MRSEIDQLQHGVHHMAIVTLTTRLIESKQKLAPKNGLYLYDSEVKGFGARVAPTCITWFAQKSIGKSTQRIVVGHYPAMSLKDARIEAGHTIIRLAKGEDVSSARAQAKQAKVQRLQCPTIKTASSDYLDQRPGDASSRYERDVRHLFERQIVPELGASTRVNEVTKAHIRKLIKARRDKGHNVAARNLYAQLRPFFSWCVHEEYIAVSPCDGVVAPDVATERQHKLSEAEIIALWSVSIAYFKVLLLTAQRRSEVGSMQWQEINLDKAEWIIPASKTKNGREHLVPLSTSVVAILRSLPQRKPSEYVFGKYVDAPFTGFSKATRELQADMLAKLREDDEEAEQSAWRIHDLRRTAASGMAALRVQPHVIEAVLNHTVSKLQRTYQVYLYADEKREALQQWADHVSAICTSATECTIWGIRERKRIA